MSVVMITNLHTISQLLGRDLHLLSPVDREDSVDLFLKDGMVDDIHQRRSTEFQKVDLKLLVSTAFSV
jgi:hypothetical protein